MIAFNRLATFLFFVLSLSFLTCAASTSGKLQDLAVRGDECGTVLNALVQLEAKLKGHLDVCAHADVLAAVDVKLVDPMAADINACVDVVTKVGAIANVNVKVKAEIVARIAAVVTLVARILIKISAKLSVSVVASICAQIDVCLKALLLALNICISGVVGLSLKAIVDLTVIVFIKVKLALCANLLGLLKLSV